MAKLKLYEIRQRGQFMLQGHYCYAPSHKLVKLIFEVGFTSCNVVIEAEPGANFGDWHLITSGGCGGRPQIITANKENIDPHDNDSKKRMAFAKKCEAGLQGLEEKPNLDYSNFDEQLKEYETIKKDSETFIEKSLSLSARCLKECVLAETAITQGEKKKCIDSLVYAHKILYYARISARKSHVQGSIKPNAADLSVANAQQQIAITIKKNKKEIMKKYQNKITSTSQAKAIGMA